MEQIGIATYRMDCNCLEVIRPGENFTRRIDCYNIYPEHERIFGVQVDGDEIWVLVGPKNNPRPDRRVRYQFSTLCGGSSEYRYF